jgi:hypothetical protein
MAPSSKANYKTYEAQARLVRAIVAAHPEVKWNYKEIVASYGSDMTEDALNHRFRRLRAESTIIREARTEGLDMRDFIVSESLPKTINQVDKKNISKYFGGGGANTMSSPLVRTPATARSVGSTGRRTKTTGAKKRAPPTSFIKRSDSDIEDEDDDDLNEDSQDWSGKDMDETPSKRVKTEATPRTKTTPSRRAATRAAATIADSTNRLDSSDESEAVTAQRPRTSLFGDVQVKQPKPESSVLDSMTFNGNGHDSYMGSDDLHDYEGMAASMGMGMTGDGEI